MEKYMDGSFGVSCFDDIRRHSLGFLCQGYIDILHMLAENIHDRVQCLVDRASSDRCVAHIPRINKLLLEIQGIRSTTAPLSLDKQKLTPILLRETPAGFTEWAEIRDSVSKLTIAFDSFSLDMGIQALKLKRVKLGIEMVQVRLSQFASFANSLALLTLLFACFQAAYSGVSKEKRVFGTVSLFLLCFLGIYFKLRGHLLRPIYVLFANALLLLSLFLVFLQEASTGLSREEIVFGISSLFLFILLIIYFQSRFFPVHQCNSL